MPHPRSLRTGLAAGLALLLVCAWRHHVPAPPRPPAAPLAIAPTVFQATRADPTPRPTTPPSASRDEVVAYLTRTYRHEQIARELDLEQRRYAEHYWQPERDGLALAALGREREALVRSLTAEANDILRHLFPDDSGAGVTLTPLFDDDHPGPNVGMLSPASRAALIGVLESAPELDRTSLLARAEDILNGLERQTFRAWNAPDAAALRQELIGFGASETEFLAVLADRRTNPGSSSEALAAALGPERYAELLRSGDPAQHTAVTDLNRLGLPLEHGTWLARTREDVTAAIQTLWAEPGLSDAAKRTRAAELQRRYGQTIAAKLSLDASSVDELGVP